MLFVFDVSLYAGKFKFVIISPISYNLRCVEICVNDIKRSV